MRNVDRVRISRRIAYLLRHNPESENLSMDTEGYVSVSDLIRVLEITEEELVRIVEQCDKTRYSFSSDRLRIRANQGHSIGVTLDFEETKPPEFLYHGTSMMSVEAISSIRMDFRFSTILRIRYFGSPTSRSTS